MKWLWQRLMLFSYRRWAESSAEPPTGVPRMRDPDSRCTAFAPRPRKWNDWGKCQTDGHYLCGDCCHQAQPESELITLAGVYKISASFVANHSC